MRLRIVLLTLLAILFTACTGSGENEGPDSVSDAVETLQPTIDAAEETLEPAATDVAATVESVITPSALACESLPEVTTETENDETITVPENAVAVFQKTGGFAGVSEQTVIYADGYIENDKNESLQSSPEVVGTLVSTAEDIGFFDFDGNFVPEGHCCDYFNYSLTVRDCDQMNTVITADEVPGAPGELTALIQTIETLISQTSAAVPTNRNS